MMKMSELKLDKFDQIGIVVKDIKKQQKYSVVSWILKLN